LDEHIENGDIRKEHGVRGFDLSVVDLSGFVIGESKVLRQWEDLLVVNVITVVDLVPHEVDEPRDIENLSLYFF
jgi:hypothetical protein